MHITFPMEKIMYLSRVEIENFRIYGQDSEKLSLELRAGINLIAGENNSGKSALMDALRLALGTRDHETVRVTPYDFHIKSGKAAQKFTIRCTFTDLDEDEAAAFVEWLNIERLDGTVTCSLTVTLEARRKDEKECTGRFDKPITLEWKAGPDIEGRVFDGSARESLRTTYLKPLRDAEQELSAKRGSRLSQIFSKHPAFEFQDDKTDSASLSGIMHLANTQLRGHDVLKSRVDDLNSQYLQNLTLGDDPLSARINIAPVSLRGILERLALSVADEELEDVRHGLGLDNLLFIATEFLLLQGPQAPLRLALIEEPEAHLHPQLQLRLVEFLEAQLSGANAKPVQVLLTSHSPNLTSKVDLENVTLMRRGQAFSLAAKCTQLTPGDYEHLRYFLDATKSNLFFARGVLIVEGPAENLLLPALAEALGRSLSRHGVSVVNVGHIGLFRYSTIFQRNSGPNMDVRVATLTDRDIPPDEAKVPLDGLTPLVKPDSKTLTGYTADEITKRIASRTKHEGGPVRAYVSPEWTLEYDLAFHGFALHLFVACELAQQKGALTHAECEALLPDIVGRYKAAWKSHGPPRASRAQWACFAYAPLTRTTSKTAAAYYLAWLFKRGFDQHKRAGTEGAYTTKLARKLPAYLVEAIFYTTRLPQPPAAAPVAGSV
jgi:putative ATP-dependent endonuclease of the OLD family